MDHHAAAIAMGELCVERAVHQELRDLCAHMIEAQTAENVDMVPGVQPEPYSRAGVDVDVHAVSAYAGMVSCPTNRGRRHASLEVRGDVTCDAGTDQR